MQSTRELVAEYLAEKVALGQYTGRSVQTARSVLRNFATVDKPLAELNKRDITVWLAGQAGSANTQRSRLSAVRTFLEWCADNGIIERNPAHKIPLPKVRETQPRYLEVREVTELYRALPTRHRRHPVTLARNSLIVALAVQMGLRRIEVWRINVADIDHDDRLLAVRGKGYRGEVSRYAPFTIEAWAALRDYLDKSPVTSGPLIRSTQTGERLIIDEISVIVSDAMTRAGIKQAAYDGKSMHALRHTFAQHLVDADTNVLDVQAAMGHTQVSTTQIYLRRSRASKLRAVIEGRTYAAGA